MGEGLPPIQMDFNATGAPVVIVEQVEVTDPALILQHAPALADPQWVKAYTQLVNHLAQGYNFEPIFDPEAFKTAYMTRYDAEDPDEVPQQGRIRLHDFGVPDFAAIKAPAIVSGTLVFFAEAVHMGIPYRVSMTSGGQPSYQPVAMVE